jgi:tetratricopeptide (TPR) repeat protein
MAECSDKRFQSMLHAYELGMLTDGERRELELHMLECPACLENVRQFQETIRLIRQDEDIRGTIDEIDAETSPADEKKPKWRLRPALVPTTAVALIVLFLLILKPWQIEIRPTQEAIAARNRLAIMYFDNIPDPEDPKHLGEILTNLLITDLAESHYIQVISHQHFYDLIQLMELDGARGIDKETATKIAEKAHANWMLMGSILQVEPHLEVTAQLVDVETGGVVASQRVTGEVEENLFSLVDKLTVEVKKDLSLPPEAFQEIDRPIAEATTHSAEAYRAYLEGLNIYYTFHWSGALEKFEEALSYDSTFAMAYYYIAQLDDRRLIDSALKYAENASQKEQLYIQSRKKIIDGDTNGAIADLETMVERFPDEKLAWYLLGVFYYTLSQTDESITRLERSIEIDPLYKAAHNQLAYTYNRAGDFEQAIEAINTYIALVPDEANPYDSRGEIYADHGMIEEAIASYEMALKKNPDFENAVSRLSLLYIQQKNYTRAEESIKRYISMGDSLYRATRTYLLAYVPLFQGKLEEALEALDYSIEQVRQVYDEDRQSSPWHVKATIHEERGDLAQARADMEKAIAINREHYPGNPVAFLDLYAPLLAKMGEVELAQAVMDTLQEHKDESALRNMCYYFGLGGIELALGNPESAATYFEIADTAAPEVSYSLQYLLGQSYLQSGQYEKAIERFDSMLTTSGSWPLYWGIWTAKAHYYLGVAHEHLGQTEQAITRYEEFLDQWKEADPYLEEIDDARERLGRLKGKS